MTRLETKLFKTERQLIQVEGYIFENIVFCPDGYICIIKDPQGNENRIPFTPKDSLCEGDKQGIIHPDNKTKILKLYIRSLIKKEKNVISKTRRGYNNGFK
jgi:hypothetical protein